MLEELNIKSLEFVGDLSGFVQYTFKPQLRILGKKLGKRLAAVREALAALDGAKAKAQLDETGAITVATPDGEVSLTEEELLVEAAQREGFTSVSDRGLTVALDTTLTQALIEEGFVREIVSKVQSMRRDAGFNVTDHIRVYHQGSPVVEKVLKDNETGVLGDVLGDSVIYGTLSGYTADWDINGEQTSLGVEKVDG